MSFETEFNYSNAKKRIDTKVVGFNREIVLLESQIEKVESDKNVSTLEKQIDVIVERRDKLQRAKMEIEKVESLSDEKKKILCEFYLMIRDMIAKSHYMALMLFNHAGLIKIKKRKELAEKILEKFTIDIDALAIQPLLPKR